MLLEETELSATVSKDGLCCLSCVFCCSGCFSSKTFLMLFTISSRTPNYCPRLSIFFSGFSCVFSASCFVSFSFFSSILKRFIASSWDFWIDWLTCVITSETLNDGLVFAFSFSCGERWTSTASTSFLSTAVLFFCRRLL